MQALTVMGQLDWRGWWRGVVGAFVSGGAGAIGGATGGIMLDPLKFNLNDGLGMTFKLMGVAFIISAVVSLAKFLQTHPVPEVVTTEVTHTTTEKTETKVTPSPEPPKP